MKKIHADMYVVFSFDLVSNSNFFPLILGFSIFFNIVLKLNVHSTKLDVIYSDKA